MNFPGDLGLPTFEEVCNSRRRKTCFLPENALLNCLTINQAVPGDVIVKLSLDVPPGTTITARSYSVVHQAECLTLVNPDWPELAPGEQGEVLQVAATYVTVKASEPQIGGAQPLLGVRTKFTDSCVPVSDEHLAPAREAAQDPFNKTWRDRPPQL